MIIHDTSTQDGENAGSIIDHLESANGKQRERK